MKVYVVTDNSYFFIGLSSQLEGKYNEIVRVHPQNISKIQKENQEGGFYIFFLDSYYANILPLVLSDFFDGRVVFLKTSLRKSLDIQFNRHVHLDYCSDLECILRKMNSEGASTIPIKGIKDRLTEREVVILRHVFQGRSPHFISHKLCISIKTFYSHRRNAFHKLGGRNIFEVWPIKEYIYL